jgi:hypothetical protein
MPALVLFAPLPGQEQVDFARATLVYARAVAEFEKPFRPLDRERTQAEHPGDSRSDQ